MWFNKNGALSRNSECPRMCPAVHFFLTKEGNVKKEKNVITVELISANLFYVL